MLVAGFETPLTLVRVIIIGDLVAVQSLGIFNKINQIMQSYFYLHFLKIPELWTATKSHKRIALTKVRGVLKTSFQWLLSGVKQKIPKCIFDCVLKA